MRNRRVSPSPALSSELSTDPNHCGLVGKRKSTDSVPATGSWLSWNEAKEDILAVPNSAQSHTRLFALAQPARQNAEIERFVRWLRVFSKLCWPNVTMHLGILKVDSVREEFIDVHGDYSDMFEHLLLQRDPTLQITVFDVQRGELPTVSDCDGYLITGSRDSVYDELPWIPPLVEFVRVLRTKEIKLAAICFGHQLVAHFFGGEVGPAANGWVVGVQCSDIVHQNDWMTPTCEKVNILSSHKDQVLKLPVDAKVFATSSPCPVSGFTVGEHTLAFQGHPEFQKEYARSLMTFRKDLLGDEVFEDGLDSLSRRTDQPLMGQWLVNFFRGHSETG